MSKYKIELERCFISSIDATKSFVDYNEYIMDPDGEICQYILQLFTYNFDNISSKKSSFAEDSFLSQIIPPDVNGFDAFVDVVTDEMHDLLGEAYGMSAGSGLFVYATVEEQPIIAFFKLNYQARLSCEKNEEGVVVWKKDSRLLPAHTQKEYDYFFINIYDKKVWMSDTRCIIDGVSTNYMAEKILQLELQKSEKEFVSVFETAVLDTIKECYDQPPKKVFEYRQAVASEVEERGNLNPVRMEEVLFADNEVAKENFREKVEELELPTKPVEVSQKTQRKLKKKQKIVTENGIEILVPIEYLEDKDVFDYRQDESGTVSIVIRDCNGTLK